MSASTPTGSVVPSVPNPPPSSATTMGSAAVAAAAAVAGATTRTDWSMKYPDSLLTVLRGFRNGVWYGCKIRFPHALVMTFLFRDGPLIDKFKAIFEATYTHARNLGCYVAAFKFIREVLRHMRNKEDHWNTTIAGFIAGGFMFGHNDPITSQINMYVMSRVIFGWGRTSVNHGVAFYRPWIYRVYAAINWAMVMYLFFHQKGTLQSSLISSMDYLYVNSDKWPKQADGAVDWFLR